MILLRMLLPLSAALCAGPALAQDGFPLTLENCGTEITLEAPAQRIFMVNSDAIPLLSAVGGLDRVVARTSEPLEGIYDPAIYEALAEIPLITSETNATGGAVISIESILDAEPDLVLAPENAVDRALLAQAGIATYSPPAYCDSPAFDTAQPAGFERVTDEVATYGAMLGLGAAAEEANAALTADLDRLEARPQRDAARAAAIYVWSGGQQLSPYGAQSMITPIFAAAGLENVYADMPERVFDVSVEDLLDRDPETVVLLYSSGAPETQINAFTAIPSLAGLQAVQEGRVVALPFPFTDPPSPLSVEGAERLSQELDALQ
ncbi:ABC transporter substrate-binding protein [Pseudoroseicyclus aestuarii]|uniref:Iron complex transport system substrate-binding protein n=1 Tax=Pseudoroseicyclus aestuarii TaxID=1795041 RepID=A0A318SP32_9RHOB|nr:ABC transporter substrate-binding protein [Pseudoroseicyclus aestuarii]PYE81345.1 iron complex transport system substrate-binding protein [Pseudoroseicyclus aestuarii]